MIDRRYFLGGAAALLASGVALRTFGAAAPARAAAEGEFPVSKSAEQWREVLTGEQYAVLREEATERPYTSELNDEKREGVYRCAGCDNELYASETKFDSGTGWPSFYQAIGEDAVGTRSDYTLLLPRTEVHCADCGGHLGHIFDDGPQPTGKRHCINGIALNFRPSKGTES